MIHKSTPDDHAELRARMAAESDAFEERVAGPLLTDAAMKDLPGVRLWHDDVRPAPEGWVWARTNHEAKAILAALPVIEASLDHDLGYTGPPPGPCTECESTGQVWYGDNDHEPEAGGQHPCPACDGDGFIGGDVLYDATEGDECGEDLVRWMVETDHVPAVVTLHSWNPAGRRRMALLLGPTGADVRVRPYEYRGR